MFRPNSAGNCTCDPAQCRCPPECDGKCSICTCQGCKWSCDLCLCCVIAFHWLSFYLPPPCDSFSLVGQAQVKGHVSVVTTVDVTRATVPAASVVSRAQMHVGVQLKTHLVHVTGVEHTPV